MITALIILAFLVAYWQLAKLFYKWFVLPKEEKTHKPYPAEVNRKLALDDEIIQSL